METVVILDNIRSAHNVGSIFRTADGAGVKKIFVCGYTPAPTDRFGRTQPEIEKTSLGATNSVEWEQVEEVNEVLERLHKDGFSIIAVEQDSRSIPYRDWQPSSKVAFVFGNEIDGVQPFILDRADEILKIIMHGEKESLNVGVAVGIITFHFII